MMMMMMMMMMMIHDDNDYDDDNDDDNDDDDDNSWLTETVTKPGPYEYESWWEFKLFDESTWEFESLIPMKIWTCQILWKCTRVTKLRVHEFQEKWGREFQSLIPLKILAYQALQEQTKVENTAWEFLAKQGQKFELLASLILIWLRIKSERASLLCFLLFIYFL